MYSDKCHAYLGPAHSKGKVEATSAWGGGHWKHSAWGLQASWVGGCCHPPTLHTSLWFGTLCYPEKTDLADSVLLRLQRLQFCLALVEPTQEEKVPYYPCALPRHTHIRTSHNLAHSSERCSLLLHQPNVWSPCVFQIVKPKRGNVPQDTPIGINNCVVRYLSQIHLHLVYLSICSWCSV